MPDEKDVNDRPGVVENNANRSKDPLTDLAPLLLASVVDDGNVKLRTSVDGMKNKDEEGRERGRKQSWIKSRRRDKDDVKYSNMRGEFDACTDKVAFDRIMAFGADVDDIATRLEGRPNSRTEIKMAS